MTFNFIFFLPMRKFFKIAFLCAVLAIATTLAGCGNKAPFVGQDNNKTASQNYNPAGIAGSNNEAKQVFEDTVEVELPDSPVLSTESQIRHLLKQVFGDLKVSSYLNDTLGVNSMVITYNISRLPSPNDLNSVSKILKDNGYKATMENNMGGQAVAMYQGKNYDLSINFSTTQSLVGVSYYPHVGGGQQ